jgi:hypothetical protein
MGSWGGRIGENGRGAKAAAVKKALPEVTDTVSNKNSLPLSILVGPLIFGF